MTSLQQIGARLRAARERAGFTQAEIGAELGVSAAAISHYESGKRGVDALTLDRLSRLYSVPILSLFDDDASPAGWETMLRARSARLSMAARRSVSRLIQAIRDFEHVQQVTGSESAPTPTPSSSFSALTTPNANEAEAMSWAEKTRRHFDIGTAPLVNLNAFLGMHGYHVFTVSLGADEDGLSGLFLNHPELGPIIAVNADAAYACRPQSLAHGFAHALFHYDRSVILCRDADNDPDERFADLFAVNLLMPGDALADLLRPTGGTARSPAQVVRLARYFGVSYQTLVQRLARMELLQSGVNWDIQPLRLAVQMGFDISCFELGARPLPLAERFPSAFLERALGAALGGRISPRRVAEMLGISFLEIEELIDPDVVAVEERGKAYA